MSQLELPHDFSGVVRLFPLPNLVVFPSIVQPLHIYESRYREMIEDAIAHDNLIAMATLLPGYSASEYFARPTVSQHVCIGQISKYRRNDDGTYDFILTGIARAEIIEELEPLRSFRSARVRVLTSDETVNNAAYILAGKLCERLQAVSKDAHPLTAQFQANQISLRTLTDSLGFHFPFSSFSPTHAP